MIDEYTYGCFKINGREFLGDIKIKNNIPHYWQDMEDRKLKVRDVTELLEQKPDVFVVGTGAGGLLDVGDDVKDYIMSQKLNLNTEMFFAIKKNTDAIKLINDSIKEGKKVCAILAGGC